MTLASTLRTAGREFIRVGLDAVYAQSWETGIYTQIAVGNLLTGLELLLKAHVAESNPERLFLQLPSETAQVLSQTGYGLGKVPPERIHAVLDAVSAKTITLEETLALLLKEFPDARRSHFPVGKDLARWRGAALHFVLPARDSFHAKRAAYEALRIVSLLNERSRMSPLFELKEADREFLAEFPVVRSTELWRKRQRALNRVPKKPLVSLRFAVGGEVRNVTCPVCGSNGIGFGDDAIYDDEGRIARWGTRYFQFSGFECEDCGLELGDDWEMTELGMPPSEHLGEVEPETEAD